MLEGPMILGIRELTAGLDGRHQPGSGTDELLRIASDRLGGGLPKCHRLSASDNSCFGLFWVRVRCPFRSVTAFGLDARDWNTNGTYRSSLT